MLNLNTILDVSQIAEVNKYTELRLNRPSKYVCAESIALYEQRILPEEEIHKLCEQAVKRKLYNPASSIVPREIVKHFRETSEMVPIAYNSYKKQLTVVAITELGDTYEPIPGVKVFVVYVPLYIYFKRYIEIYGNHPDLLPVPAKTIYSIIIQEATDLKAADITLSTNGLNSRVYFNVRKQKVDSHVIMQASMLEDIIKILTIEDPKTAFDNKPKYVGVNINDHYRGRIVINKTYKGSAVTIRLLPNSYFDNTLEDCNLKPQTIEFLRNDFMNRENGLRLIAGPTMSGKNTTILSCLNELLHLRSLKIVSIEMPVEQELPGIEQINCTTMEEYKTNINSLIRQNPDFVYVTEMNDDTSVDVLRAANTGKRSISTIHANSCSDIIPRLMDITGLSIDRIIQPLHSLVYQELIRDDLKNMLVPVNRYVYLSKERKQSLYGKTFGEVMAMIDSWEGGDIW